MSKEVGTSIGLHHATVTEDLDITLVAVKFVSWLLTAEQKEKRFFAATDLLQCA
jgi:hypothetical protein